MPTTASIEIPGSAETTTIGESFLRAVERFGDHDAIVVSDQRVRVTYSELWTEVDRAARAFDARHDRPRLRCGRAAGAAVGVRHRGADDDPGVRGCGPRADGRRRPGWLSRAGAGDPARRRLDWFVASGDCIDDAQLAERERRQDLDEPINVQFRRCSIDDYMFAALSHRDVLDRACSAARPSTRDTRDQASVPVLHQRLGTLLGAIVCADHGACLVL